jgi:hypothetical protein
MAISRGAIVKDGKTYTFAGEKLAIGRDAAVKAIVDSQELQDKVLKALEEINPAQV